MTLLNILCIKRNNTEFPDLPWINHIQNPSLKGLKRAHEADSCQIGQLMHNVYSTKGDWTVYI